MLPTKPHDWDEALAPEKQWQAAYGFVEERVKHLFDELQNPRHFATDELVEFLYPGDWARGAGITARKRIYTALRALAKHGLADYCEPGPQRKLKHTGKLVTPLIWRAPPPAEPKLCPHCGGVL